MTADRRCEIEKLTETTGIPFLSIKGNELVFNTNYLNDPEFKYGLGIRNGTRQGMIRDLIDNLRINCEYCHLCNPRFRSYGEDLRIDREGYEYRDDEEGLYGVTRFAPQGEAKATICVVDDHPLVTSYAELFASQGYESFAFRAYTKGVYASDLENSQFAKAVLEKNPHLVISDKGLGYLDGIYLLKTVKELSEGQIITIMWTGEPDTRETHKVSDYFLIKPVTATQMLETVSSALNEKFGIQ